MPISPPQVAAALIPSLAGVTMVGTGVPKFVQGFGIGLTTWTPTITIRTTDAGTAGAGKGVPVPISLAPPTLFTNLLAGMVSQGLTGVQSPAFVQGITQGLVTLYLQAFTNTVHAGVGVGAGVATFSPPPASSPITTGFAAVGMTGEGALKLARALAQGLENTFKVLLLPQPIVGPPSPVGASGSGFGSII